MSRDAAGWSAASRVMTAFPARLRTAACGRQRHITGPLPSWPGSGYFPFLPFPFFFLLFLATRLTPLQLRQVNDMLTKASTYH